MRPIGLSGGTAAGHELLFLADSEHKFVCSLELQPSGKQVAGYVFKVAPQVERVFDVAYSAELETVFVATEYNYTHNGLKFVAVRSITRTSTSEWSSRYEIGFSRNQNGHIGLRILSDGTLYCGEFLTSEVHMYRVMADRSIQKDSRLQLSGQYNGFDVQMIGTETRLAASLENGAVTLFRVEADRVVQLSSVLIPGSSLVLFVGENLLVKVLSGRTAEGIMVSTAGGRLRREGTLISKDFNISIDSWCFVNDTLFVYDSNSNEVHVYNAMYDAHIVN